MQFILICILVLVISVFIGQYVGNLYISKESSNSDKYTLPKQYLPLTAIIPLRKEKEIDTEKKYENIIEIKPLTPFISHATPTPKQDIKPTVQNNFFKIQVGAFSTKDAAEKVRDNLINNGFSAEILEKQKDNKTLFVVHVGKFKTREEADRISDNIKQLGYETFVTR